MGRRLEPEHAASAGKYCIWMFLSNGTSKRYEQEFPIASEAMAIAHTAWMDHADAIRLEAITVFDDQGCFAYELRRE